VRLLLGNIRIIKETEREGIFTRMGLLIMEIGKMEVKKVLAVSSIVMVYIWVNVSKDLEMAREFICLKMDLVMKETGKKVSVKAGVLISIQLVVSIQENI
jgi:hypothetical protein